MAASTSLRFRWWVWIVPAFFAVLLALLPNLTQRFAHGTWLYLGGDDDHYYAMIARAPFLGSWALRDPFANSREAIGVSYAWGLFVPMAKLSALFGKNPAAFLIGWRVLGGLLLGAGLWSLLETLLRRCGASARWLAGSFGVSGLAALAAAILICDPGFDCPSLPFERLLLVVHGLVTRAPISWIGWYQQFRIISPLSAIGILFAFLALLCRPKLDRRAAILSGLLLGLLFNLYFFFWTTAVALLVALAALQYLPRRVGRWFGVRQPPGLLLLILLIGGTLGLPQLISDLSSFGDPVIKEALERSPRGLSLAWHNPERWAYIAVPRLWFDCLLALVAAIRVRALRVPALLVFISLALANSAIVTGLQFENYKWLHVLQTVSYLSTCVWGLAGLARILQRWRPSLIHIVRAGLLVTLGVVVGLALLWIPRECLQGKQAVERSRWQYELRGLEPTLATFVNDSSLVAPIEAQSALLSTSCGVLYDPSHAIASFISDKQFIERHVLSAWVLGEDRSRLDLRSYLLPRLHGETRERWTHVRENYKRAVEETPASELDRFRVRYALTPCGRPPTVATGDWRALGGNGCWCAWERHPTLPKPETRY